MLPANSQPTIKNAILKRLGAERDVRVCDMMVVPCLSNGKPANDDQVEANDNDVGYIHVEVFATLTGGPVINDNETPIVSMFELPVPFEHAHLLNEIDEIAEHLKQVRRDLWLPRGGRAVYVPITTIAGTGLRGGWRQYG
jgi:hypothetical protein